MYVPLKHWTLSSSPIWYYYPGASSDEKIVISVTELCDQGDRSSEVLALVFSLTVADI